MRALASSALILAGITAQPVRADLVNGSFEPYGASFTYQPLPGGSTSIPGWTTTDSSAEWFQPTAFGDTPAPDGMFAVDLANHNYSAGGVQQTFATQPGKVQVLQFLLGTTQTDGRDGTGEVVVADDASATLSLRACRMRTCPSPSSTP